MSLIPILAQHVPPTEVLNGFARYNPTLLFRGLLEGVGNNRPLLEGLNFLALLIGGTIVLWGHAMRAKGKRASEMFDEQIRTVVVFALMFMGGWIVGLLAEGMDAIQTESGLGNSTQIATRMVQRAYAMPELVRTFDAMYASDAYMAARNTKQQNQQQQQQQADKQLLMDQLDGSLWGTTKAFFTAMWQTGRDGVQRTADVGMAVWMAAEKVMTFTQAFFSAMLKILIIIITISLVHIFLLIGGGIMWVMENLRYFLLAVGAALMPPFIAMFALPENNPIRKPAYDYVTNMIGYAMWPLAWTIGHSVTVELYNAWVSLMAGTTRLGQGLETAMAWDSATTIVQRQQVMQSAMADWVGGGILQLIALPIGALGLFFWIVAVTVYGPVVLHKMMTTGSSFASELSRQTASQTAQAAGTALQIGGAVVGGPAGLAMASAGGAIAGAAKQGVAGAFSGTGEGLMGFSRDVRSLQEAGVGGGGGGGGG